MSVAARALALACLTPLPALADLAPGFWSFPDRPDLPRAEIAALCATGFSLVYDDGIAQSFLLVETAEGPALWMDSEMTCQPGGEAGTSCEGWVDNGNGPEPRRQTRISSQDGEGLRFETRVEGHGDAPVITFPRPCPAEGVRAALALGLIPAN